MLSLKLVHGAEFAIGVAAEARTAEGQTRLTIGRDPGCDWHIPDMTRALSGRHCEIVIESSGPVLHDLSTNGTFVNGATARMAGDHPLHDGDHFLLGPYLVAVSLAHPHPHPRGRPAPRLRGADPAAAMADEETSVTRISPAPRASPPAAGAAGASGAAAQPAAVKPMPPVAAAPRPAQHHPRAAPARAAAVHESVKTAELLQALAAGLGLPRDALAGRDPVEMAGRVGALARVALESFTRMNDQQARLRRQIGSRERASVRADEAHALRLAASPDDALLALLRGPADAGALALQHGFADLHAHHDRLAAAIRRALQRLAEDLEPASIERAIDRDGQTAMQTMRKAALWNLYTHVWQTTGLGDDNQPWAQSFVDAALLHLAAAYDGPLADAPPAAGR